MLFPVPGRLLFAILLIPACRDSHPPASTPARDLTSALQSPAAHDTAAQRADSQFQTCLYVYDSEEWQRECLVLKSGWAPADAERRLAARRAAIQQVADSVNAIAAAERQAVERRQASIRAAEARRDAQEAAAAAAAAYWGSPSDSTYYTNTPNCPMLYKLTPGRRRFFQTPEEAERAGLKRSDEPGC
jgi:hypothetical protein